MKEIKNPIEKKERNESYIIRKAISLYLKENGEFYEIIEIED